MRGGPKTLIVALIALLLAFGATACGGDDDSSSTASSDQTQGATDGGAEQGDANRADQDSGGSDGGEGNSDAGDDGASNFVPKQHDDSGGGSNQFKVKGGDNSVQEFGEEADDADFEAAATALHNFLDARAQGNSAAACQYMSQALTESFEKLASRQAGGQSCAESLDALTNPAAKGVMKAEAAQADVGSLRIEDEQAFLIYTGLEDTTFAMPMANEDDEWKVGSIAGTPLN